MHGSGTYTWDDGRRYQGDYKDDKKHGFGAYMLVDGRVYYGNWKEGLQHGEGSIVLPNMQIHKAYYENGKETMKMEPEEVEKEEIINYVQNMQKERERMMKNRTSSSRRSRTTMQSKTKQLMNVARMSLRNSQAA